MSRKRLPITPAHRKGCTRRRDCDCPWTFRVRLPDGTQPRQTRDTYAEAEQAYHELLARRPDPLADRTTTIAQWAERWLTVARGTDGAAWRPGTLIAHRCTVRKHILPELGHYPVTGLRRDDVRLWAAGLAARGAGMRNAVVSLRAMYGAWLADDRMLPHGNPVPPGLVKEQPRKEFMSLTAAQVDAIAAEMLADKRLIVHAEAFYGGRVSEILALREEDITFTGRDMTAPLAPQLARLAALPADKYDARKPQLRFCRKLEPDRTPGPIKNKRGNRTLPLPQWLAEQLAEQLATWPPAGGWLFVNRHASAGSHRDARAWRADVAEATGLAVSTVSAALRPGPGDRIPEATQRRVGETAARLGYGAGQPYSPGTYEGMFSRAAARAGVTLPPGQCTHALRHHCVSVLRAKGWSDQDIGYWIGDSPQTVATVYGRPMPDALTRISAQLSEGRTTEERLRAVD